jgi:hypothetical protein
VFRLVLARTKRRWVDHIFIRVMSGFVARAEVSMAQAALCAVRSRAFWPSSLYSRIAQQTLHGIQVRCRGRRCSGFRRAAQRSSSSHSRPLPLMPCPPCSPLQFLHLPSRNPPPPPGFRNSRSSGCCRCAHRWTTRHPHSGGERQPLSR